MTTPQITLPREVVEKARKSCWVVMSSFNSPIAFSTPTPKAVFLSKKEAKNFCYDHNTSNRTSTQYYLRKADLK